MPEAGCVLAFDYGEKRLGVAVGNELLAVAHPLATINVEASEPRFAAIAALIAEWRPQLLIVGLPSYLDGVEHEVSRLARRFARRLHGRFGLPVGLIDERLSSAAASQALNETGRRGRKQKPALDQVAAMLILQSYFDDPQRQLLPLAALANTDRPADREESDHV